VFFLDWEAFPSHEVQIAAPRLTVLYAETRKEIGKDLLNAASYDLVYAIENNMIIEVRPADSRDLPMHEDGRVFLFGNQHQTAIYGDTLQSQTDPKVMETTLLFTPTGIGEGIASLGYFNKSNHYHEEPYRFNNTSTYTLRDLVNFDSVLGLQLDVKISPMLNPNKSSEAIVTVSEIGTNAPVEGAKVVVEGPGIKTSGTTNDKGVCMLTITPSDKGIITFNATMEDMVDGKTERWVTPDESNPNLALNPVAQVTNKSNLTVTGTTDPGNKVTVNGQPANVSTNGTFSTQVMLEEGLNTIVATATSPNGKTIRCMITVTLDTTKPLVFVDDPGTVKGATNLTLTGRVEPDCEVTVNGKPAKVVHDIWSSEVNVKPGKNIFTIVAKDTAGNTNTVNFEVVVE
ncbi:MAG: hypothetical protein KAH01_04160, partial [Caldisericia bacterium]|nr:hypothetical protein [Caldisericia bacterium]